MCDVLDDMRKMYETRNFSGLLGSIEQLQVMAYRMESALSDERTIEEYDEEAAKLNRDLKAKHKEKKHLVNEVNRLKEDKEDLEKQIKELRHAFNKESKGGTQLN